jgi:ATP/maltotriose-dependent transcriptional regulator MalT
MVEPPVTAPGSDALLATKLHMPGPRPGQVLRPRLTARLDEGQARGLVLASAPAGYGKTVLLADWARHGEHPVAWLSLDAGDNDPARFWHHAVAALDRALPGTGDRVAPLLGPPAPSSFQGLVTALINDLAGEEALLVLDDYHLISARQVHESLAFLVEHRPAGICVVLASRSDPPLPLARLRARGQLAEIRVADLRFTPEEAGELLQHAASALPDASVAALAARTEGWAAGLQLAALSLRGHDDAAAFVAAFTGSHRYVLDYLAEEVLEGQDEQLRTFLLETSVLERLSGPLCDAVTGREGSQVLLEEAERAGLFLIPLDEVRGWWRYHHLFADLLRARLLQEQPGRLAQLHRNAAAWCQEHGLADEAIGHAAAAGEMLWAARIIEQQFDLVHRIRGEAATIDRWLSVLPADVVRSRPRLLLAQGDLAAAASFAQDNGLGPDDEPDYARESGHLVLARLLLAQHRAGQSLALLDRLHATAKAQNRTGSLIEISALRALALAATGDETGAVTTLAGTLLLACPQGYVRVFADEGPPMAALLGRLIVAQRTGSGFRAAAEVPLGYLARLQRAFGPGRPARDSVPSGIVDPLTSRELEVLEMLAAGRSNQAIAGELVVTLDTVKKHVGHVLGKLGAANRTEAVARARELNLL